MIEFLPVCINCHFFLIPLRWRIRQFLLYLDNVRLEATIFGQSGSSPKPDKIVGQIESGLTEVYCTSLETFMASYVSRGNQWRNSIKSFFPRNSKRNSAVECRVQLMQSWRHVAQFFSNCIFISRSLVSRVNCWDHKHRVSCWGKESKWESDVQAASHSPVIRKTWPRDVFVASLRSNLSVPSCSEFIHHCFVKMRWRALNHQTWCRTNHNTLFRNNEMSVARGE